MTFQLQTDKNPFQFHIIFIGMNPLREASLARTKESIREIRHVYVDTPAPNFVLDTPHEKNQVVWRVEGLDQA